VAQREQRAAASGSPIPSQPAGSAEPPTSTEDGLADDAYATQRAYVTE
jgi:hypothetical protein